MFDMSRWLAEQGLGHLAAAVRDNGIAPDILRDLTDADLKELGLNLGDRKRLRRAIAALQPLRMPLEAPRAPTVAPHPREVERRQLTVMFADLVGSTPLAAALDPEDLREVITAYHTAVAEVVVRFGGHVAKYLGDGVVAYWGWPSAQEDAAERAVRAGLTLVDAVGGLRQRGGSALRVRVGIATGQVVVGTLGGAGAAHDDVVGETPNLAARLQALAEPGAVVVADTTRRLAGPLFAYENLGERRVRGFPAPMPLWRVAGEAPAAAAPQPRRTVDFGPLVGRGPELARLLERWERTQAGHGQVVLLTGEAGIGKSRVVEGLRERLADVGHAERHFACSPLRETSALHPVLSRLERAAGLRRDEAAEQSLRKLAAALELPEAGEAVSAIAGLLGIPAAQAGV